MFSAASVVTYEIGARASTAPARPVSSRLSKSLARENGTGTGLRRRLRLEGARKPASSMRRAARIGAMRADRRLAYKSRKTNRRESFHAPTLRADDLQFRYTAVLRSSERAIVAILSHDATQNGQVMAIAQKNARELKAILAAKLGAGDFQLEVREDALGWYVDVSGQSKIQISYLQSMADELVEEMRSHYDLKL